MMDSDWMLNELNNQRATLEGTLKRTSGSLDAKMRATVWDVIATRFAPVKEPVEEKRQREKMMQIHISVSTSLDTLLGSDSGQREREYFERLESSRQRPDRIFNYLKTLFDVVPNNLLIPFLHYCLKNGPEETIGKFEVKTGEAASRDYYGESSGFDPSSLIAQPSDPKN